MSVRRFFQRLNLWQDTAGKACLPCDEPLPLMARLHQWVLARRARRELTTGGDA